MEFLEQFARSLALAKRSPEVLRCLRQGCHAAHEAASCGCEESVVERPAL